MLSALIKRSTTKVFEFTCNMWNKSYSLATKVIRFGMLYFENNTDK